MEIDRAFDPVAIKARAADLALRYPLRSVLAASGIAIGTATMVLLANLVGSVYQVATAGLVKVGERLIIVSSQTRTLSQTTRLPVPVSIADADALRRQLRQVDTIAPSMLVGTTYRGCDERLYVVTQGVAPEHIDLDNWTVSQGRFVAVQDTATKRRVVVFGDTVHRRLPCLKVGSFVQINGLPFEIIGILARRGGSGGTNNDIDYVAMVPFSTAEHYMSQSAPRGVTLLVWMKDSLSAQRGLDDIRHILRRTHALTPEDVDDFSVQSQGQVLSDLSRLANGTTAGLFVLLSWTLVVAAIGVLNSLFTAVAERTPEIGLRRAVGATRRSIRAQFVVESLMISTGGAAAGVMLGVATSMVIALAFGLPRVVNWTVAVAASTLSCVLGVLAAAWPARRAGTLDPVEALRHE